MRVHCFAPIIDEKSEVLVLGTAPGIQSLVKEEYYGHGGNRFWSLMAAVLNEKLPSDYEGKKQMLLRHKVALWDVIEKCDRKTAADKDIQNEKANDFGELLENYPGIKRIIFNGHKPEYYFNLHVKITKSVDLLVAKSTSPANRRNYSFDDLFQLWKPLIKLN